MTALELYGLIVGALCIAFGLWFDHYSRRQKCSRAVACLGALFCSAGFAVILLALGFTI